MASLLAIVTGKLRSYRSSGGTSRSEFLWRAAFLLPIAFTLSAYTFPNVSTLADVQSTLILTLAYWWPIAAALVHRARDAGLSSNWPAATAGFAILAWGLTLLRSVPESSLSGDHLWYIRIGSALVAILMLLRVVVSPTSPSLNSHEVSP